MTEYSFEAGRILRSVLVDENVPRDRYYRDEYLLSEKCTDIIREHVSGSAKFKCQKEPCSTQKFT